MRFRRIPPVMFETVFRVTRIIRLHQHVAVDLGDDGSRGDGDTSLVSLDQRDLRHLELFEGDRVEEEDVGTEREIVDRVQHRELAGAKDVDPVDGRVLDDSDRNGARPRQNDAADVEPVFMRDLLGVVDAEKRRIGVEDDAGGDDRAGETAAADLIRPRDAPKTKIAEPALD